MIILHGKAACWLIIQEQLGIHDRGILRELTVIISETKGFQGAIIIALHLVNSCYKSDASL